MDVPHNRKFPRFQGHLLLVDDDEDICFILQQLLLHAGLTVDLAHSYQQAIAHLKTTRYDLIFSDFNLGNRHGGRVLDYIRKRGWATPFYFISCYLSMVYPEVQRAYVKAADGWLEKPFSQDQVLAVLQRHLRPMESPAEASN